MCVRVRVIRRDRLTHVLDCCLMIQGLQFLAVRVWENLALEMEAWTWKLSIELAGRSYVVVGHLDLVLNPLVGHLHLILFFSLFIRVLLLSHFLPNSQGRFVQSNTCSSQRTI
jgi:hypothetical protein